MGRKKKVIQSNPEPNPNLNPNSEQKEISSTSFSETNEIKTEKLNDLKEEFEELKEKKPRGKAKQIYEDQKKKEDFKKSVSGIGGMFAGMLIKRLPNPIPLDDLEREQFNLAFDNIAAKYVTYIDKYQEEAAFGFALLMIVAPRMRKPVETKKEE